MLPVSSSALVGADRQRQPGNSPAPLMPVPCGSSPAQWQPYAYPMPTLCLPHDHQPSRNHHPRIHPRSRHGRRVQTVTRPQSTPRRLRRRRGPQPRAAAGSPTRCPHRRPRRWVHSQSPHDPRRHRSTASARRMPALRMHRTCRVSRPLRIRAGFAGVCRR